VSFSIPLLDFLRHFGRRLTPTEPPVYSRQTARFAAQMLDGHCVSTFFRRKEMRREFLAFLLAGLLALLGAIIVCCTTTTTTTSTVIPDDDASPAADDDDDNSGDDDDDNDDDNAPTDCTTVAQDVVGTCQVTLNDDQGNQVTQAQMVTWCQDCDQMFNGGADPFWNCMDNCAVAQSCSKSCFTACLQPADPGSGCGHTAYALYSCGVAFTFQQNTNYYVPLMDEMAYCSSDTTDNWSCFATCVSSNPCSSPPTQAQATALINCMNAC
jgi:hypothetical protein